MTTTYAYAVIAGRPHDVRRTVAQHLPVSCWVRDAWTPDVRSRYRLPMTAITVAGRADDLVDLLRAQRLPFVDVTADQADALEPDRVELHDAAELYDDVAARR